MGQKKNQIFCLLLILLSVGIKTEILSDFKKRIFKLSNLKPAIYDLDIGFGDKLEKWVVAFGDLDSAYTDIILSDSERYNLELVYFNQEKTTFETKTVIDAGFKALGKLIVSGFLSDLNNDGKNDIVVVTKNTKDSNKIDIWASIQNSDGSFDTSKLLLIAGDLPYHQPQGFQLFSDDIQLLKTYILAQKDATTKKVYSVVKEGNDFKPLEEDFLEKYVINNKEGCMEYNGARTLSSTHGGSFIDLNMDCRPDLLLETNESGKRVVEIYYYRDNGFCLVDANAFVEDNIMDSTSISFTDLARKGSNDAVIIRQRNVNGLIKLYVHVFLNRHTLTVNQESLCQNKEGSETNKPLPPFEKFDVKNGKMTKEYYYLDVNFKEANYQFKFDSDIKNELIMNVIRFGDFDMNGHMDIMLNARRIIDGKEENTYTLVLKNEDCSDGQIAEIQGSDKDFKTSDCRAFVFNDIDSSLVKVYGKASYTSAFFDWGEMGNFGVIQIQKQEIPGGYLEKPEIRAYFNYINKDNYFLKSTGKSKTDKSGDLCIGCSFQALQTEINSSKHPIVTSQSYGTSSTRLSLPYAFIGLGRINNYIEHFNFGVAKKSKFSYSWSPIIPNSQLILSANNNDPSKWGIEIFINPTKALSIIIAATIAVLILLGMCIIYFHWKEKQEDKKANEQNFTIF